MLPASASTQANCLSSYAMSYVPSISVVENVGGDIEGLLSLMLTTVIAINAVRNDSSGLKVTIKLLIIIITLIVLVYNCN